MITWPAPAAAAVLRDLAGWLDHHPDVTVTRAPTGNLAVLAPDGHYLGFLDIRTGTTEVDEPPAGTP